MSLDETKVSDCLLAGTSWNNLPDVSLVLDIYLRVACAFLYCAFPRMSVAPIHASQGLFPGLTVYATISSFKA